jgi:hypothetical protein
MFASGIWNPGKDYCHCPSGFLESLVFMVVIFFFLIVFFIGVAISDGVLSIGVQGATYVLNVIISSRF